VLLEPLRLLVIEDDKERMEKVMPIERVIGDVLDAQTEGLVIGCDGDHPKMMGPVGNQLKRRLDDDREWERIIQKARFPIAPADVHAVDVMEIPEIGFRYLMFVNLYNHHNADLYLASGYRNTVCAAYNGGVRSLAMVLHRGGWRAKFDSVSAMENLEKAATLFPEVSIFLYERAPRGA
jgi:hypothetical protein